ncbi:mCG147301 [Mus musculus]|nr:mCG147301 [Mus musculus]
MAVAGCLANGMFYLLPNVTFYCGPGVQRLACVQCVWSVETHVCL